MPWRRWGLLPGLLGVLALNAWAADPQELLQQIKSVGPRGAGHRAAQQAVIELSQQDAATLVPILTAANDADPLAANWLRGAFEAIAERAIDGGGPLPAEQLEAFVLDETNAPRIRRLAYEWLVKVDPEAPDRIIPGMLDDPSDEMRRDAVARLIVSAEQSLSDGADETARATFEQALTGAVDRDQVDHIIKAFDPLGRQVDPVRHFGLLTKFRVIGPFDNRGLKGFDVAYPPEKELDFSARYEGQLGPVRWKEYVADNDEGLFDIGKLIENYKGSVMYAATSFPYESEREVQFRLTTKNAWKLWVNGELLFAREEYHRGLTFDQYRVRGRLLAGENIILLKILQDEQEHDWAQDYHFKLRVTDFSGRAIRPGTDRPAVDSD